MISPSIVKLKRKSNVKIQMIGIKYGKLTVIEEAEKVTKALRYKCKCDCGNFYVVTGGDLRNGHTKSCGCWKKEFKKTHGMSETSEYTIWEGIIQRCTNPNSNAYKHYGGRGITVCERWLKFENFFEDIGKKPKGLTIERKNNELGYFKENCCWDTYLVQTRNQRIRKDNSTGVRGVSKIKHQNKYQVEINANHKRFYIGRFNTIQQAKEARQQAELKYWGRKD